jgi:hypothetical protein
MGYNECKKCKGMISKYTIDKQIDDDYKNYKIKLCWACGHFSIYPNVIDDFTSSILKDKSLILTLIEEKLLRQIL